MEKHLKSAKLLKSVLAVPSKKKKTVKVTKKVKKRTKSLKKKQLSCSEQDQKTSFRNS